MSKISHYEFVERIDYIRENKGFTLLNYMRKFEISRRTAFRDIAFMNTYKDYELKLENGRYNLYRLGVEQ